MRNSFFKTLGIIAVTSTLSCNTVPTQKFVPYSFPKDVAYTGNVERPFQPMGYVRTKVNFQSLDMSHDEAELCKNYFNQAVRDMLKMARAKGADGLVQVRSIVFYEGGQHEVFPRAECSDDGMEGQVLTEAIAVKWKKAPTKSVSSATKTAPTQAN